MPLPLPVMIPFMMWQSAAIASGFGTMFQYSKRRISAMSNEEFAAADPTKIINGDLDTFISQMPSSFAKMDAMTPIILDSMLKMLTDAVRWFTDILGGQLNTPFKFGDPDPTLGLNPPLDSDTGFTPGQKGQATIPSVAWLNSLNREQLKALRNDALNGDYTEDSKTLILARYKEVFDFDKIATLPDPGSNIPVSTVTILFNLSASDYPDLHSLVLKRFNELGKGKDLAKIMILWNAQWGQADNMSKNINPIVSNKGIRLKEQLLRILKIIQAQIPNT